jgi:invasion protein IalB
MKKILKKLESIFKITLLLNLLLTLPALSAEFSTEKWVMRCTPDNKDCIIAIILEVKVKDSDIKQIFSTAYIQIGFNSEKKKVPVFFVKLPLNTNLKKIPLAKVDEELFANIPYLYCNANEGCVIQTQLTDEGLNVLKAGKELIVTFADNGIKKNIDLRFPLKGFTEAYNNLAK